MTNLDNYLISLCHISSHDSHRCICAFFGVFDFFYMVRIVFSRSTTWKQNENSLNKNCEVKISFNFF